jgi:hypothetical protein
MRKSGLSDFLFGNGDILMHAACFHNGNLLNQHAAVLVERIVDDHVHLSRYDMHAGLKLSTKNNSSGFLHKITNILEISKFAPLDNEDAITVLYDDNHFKPKLCSTHVVSLKNFTKAKDWFVKDQINTALGIAESFLKAEKDDPEGNKYFVSQDKLPPPAFPQPFGVSLIDSFLNACALLVEDIQSVQSTDASKEEYAAHFLKHVNTTCKDFLHPNIVQMHRDHYLSERLKDFRMLGAGLLLWDERHGSSRKSNEPVNCARWVKDFFEAAGARIETGSDKPKKIATAPDKPKKIATDNTCLIM